MVTATFVGYIDTLSSGTLNLIKKLNQDQVEAFHGADVHQYLTILSTGVMVLNKNVGNNIQGSFPYLWSAVNDTKEHIDQKEFGIIYLNNIVDNLNTTDLQQQITKVEATMKVLNN